MLRPFSSSHQTNYTLARNLVNIRRIMGARCPVLGLRLRRRSPPPRLARFLPSGGVPAFFAPYVRFRAACLPAGRVPSPVGQPIHLSRDLPPRIASSVLRRIMTYARVMTNTRVETSKLTKAVNTANSTSTLRCTPWRSTFAADYRGARAYLRVRSDFPAPRASSRRPSSSTRTSWAPRVRRRGRQRGPRQRRADRLARAARHAPLTPGQRFPPDVARRGVRAVASGLRRRQGAREEQRLARADDRSLARVFATRRRAPLPVAPTT